MEPSLESLLLSVLPLLVAFSVREYLMVEVVRYSRDQHLFRSEVRLIAPGQSIYLQDRDRRLLQLLTR